MGTKVVVALMLLSFSAGWTVHGWRSDAKVAGAQKVADAARASAEKHYSDLERVREENRNLVERIGSVRVRVSTDVCDSAAAGMDHGEGRAELHQEVVQRIAAVTDKADRCAVKLTAAQEWIRGGCGCVSR